MTRRPAVWHQPIAFKSQGYCPTEFYLSLCLNMPLEVPTLNVWLPSGDVKGPCTAHGLSRARPAANIKQRAHRIL